MIHFWLRLRGFHDVNSLENRDPRVIQRWSEFAQPILWRWFRPQVRGLERIPEGSALYVCNHSGGFMTPDTWIFTITLMRERGVDAIPYALAHQAVIEAPGTNQILTAWGTLAASPENAHRARGGARRGVRRSLP